MHSSSTGEVWLFWAGRRKGASHPGRTLLGTLVDAIQGSDLPAPSLLFALPLRIFPLTSKGNEVVRLGRAEDPALINKDRRQSTGCYCSPASAPAPCSALLLPVPGEQILPSGSWRAPPRLQSTQLEGVQTPKRSMTSPWRKGHQGFV